MHRRSPDKYQNMTLTVEAIKEALPAHLKSAATQELTDLVNQVSADPEAAALIRENFISYSNVLKEGRFSTGDYLNAVAYVSFKLMGHTNQEAYSRAFPQRYLALRARGATDKDISAYVAAYAKNKLVNLIFERTLIPHHVLFQDVFHKAVQEQLLIMQTAKSDMVRMQAANSLIVNLKPPEKKQIELAITTPESSGMDALKTMLTQVAERQRELIEQGATTQEIAHQRIMLDVTPAEE